MRDEKNTKTIEGIRWQDPTALSGCGTRADDAIEPGEWQTKYYGGNA
jgi:hypothetical protein